MRDVMIIGTGATPVAEHWERSPAALIRAAFRAALGNHDPQQIGAIYAANALGNALGVQAQAGAAVAAAVGLVGIEAISIDAAGASGAAALRQAYLAVASGTHDVVAVVAFEKVSDLLDDRREAALALAGDPDWEAIHGTTLTSQWAMLMRRYMHEHGYQAGDFAPFPVNAHANGAHNPLALYRFATTADKVRAATPVADPLGLLDSATLADGAAVVIIAATGTAHEMGHLGVQIVASALATDTPALHSRRDPLHLGAAARSCAAVIAQAGITHADLDLFEFTDPHGIAATLALESCGFYDLGTAPRHAADGAIAPGGTTPLATGGGYKARGDVGGASGLYQVIEIVRQLRGEAGAAQVPGARIGLAQSLGGLGGTAVSHVLRIS